jgi:hypothetical protein
MSDTQLFIESDVKLQSAISFSQYAIPIGTNFRLITIIGEQHGLKFPCSPDADQITIADYALQSLKNPAAEVLLEIDPVFIASKQWPMSVPIRAILSQSPESKNIKGYDYRNSWLGAIHRENLYHKTDVLVKMTLKQILDHYSAPFYANRGRLFALQEAHYDTDAYQFLTQVFLKNLVVTMNHIVGAANSKWGGNRRDKKSIITMLRHFWKEVTDWYMLCEIFRLSEVDSIISIMGETHRQNLAGVFSNLTLLAAQQGNAAKCVSLMKTVYIKRYSPVSMPASS